MSNLPVREIVLYKHGVGFFRREGKVNGSEITLIFRQDEINDVLKSLVVFDREGGQVLGIHYQTPLDRAARLADSSIRLSDRASLCDLLRDLRGRWVILDFAEETVEGRLIGLDVEDEVSNSLVSIVTNQRNVRAFRLKTLRGIRIRDDLAAHDLHFFLDTDMGEDVRRAVTVRLTPGKHKLVVYYVAPSPTWRVSYRLVVEAGKSGLEGSALLQGWGLFDNRLDEDLQDVSVTLVAGQPISFIYDLYTSYIPRRHTVRDEARLAPGPIEYDAALPTPAPEPEMLPQAMKVSRKLPAAMAEARSMRDKMEETVSPAVEAREAGEFFQYVVTTPVSVKRGESALVPIISSNLSCVKELLYNGAKLPAHPVAALRFTNTTGLTLERGPVTIVEDGEYRGEAVLPFSRVDGDVYLPYAVELGIQITEREQTRTEMAGLSIAAATSIGRRRKSAGDDEGYLIIQEYHVRSVTYTLENRTAQDHTVTIEAPIRTGYELFDTVAPDEETATERRWRVYVSAHSTAEFAYHERQLTRRYEEIRNLDYTRLQRFLSERWLDQETFDRLAGLLDSLAFIQNARAEQERLRAERQEIYERQAQLRENLNALKPMGEEGILRNRMLQQMEATEDRLGAIDARLTELEEQVAEAKAHIEQTLIELGEETAG
ncbi:MAG TPA: hypothetical protein ENI95_05615 [Chloroflexi bacterium]|nr:hypothetical protein [Chloroflexota bacterium]